jgi:GPH family glycoside/pentoside/hexuronide:cation symporter
MMIWSPLSAKVGKQKVYYIGVTIWILTELYFYTIQPGQYIQVLIIAIFAGAGVSVGYLIPWSLLPDVIELDELETGQRREGVYYGFFVFLQKLGLSLGLAIANFALEAAGYVNQEIGGPLPTQPDAVLQALRLFVTLIPAAVLLLSIPVVRAYPITREKHAEIKAALAKRQNTGA